MHWVERRARAGWGPGGGARNGLLVVLVLSAILVTGCSNQPPPHAAAGPTAALTAPVAATPTVLPSRSPTQTARPTDTPTPAATSTPTPTPTASLTPAPAAEFIALESYRDGNGEIYLLDATTGALANLTRNPADDRSPAWRPDGKAIAFESKRSGNWDIFVLDLIDGSLRNLTGNPAYDGAPSWSSDGVEPAQIAFESYRDGNLEIYTIPADGGNPVRLTDDPAGDYGPAWSPDGDSIAFTSWRDGDKEVYLVAADGGELRNLTQHDGDDEDPAWLPDGSGIAFTSWRDVDTDTGNRNAESFRLDLEGDGPVQRLTDNAWPDLDPAWDPMGRLVWAAYGPGERFETYDPFRPGGYQIYRETLDGPERLTASPWDDRRPAPAPASSVRMEALVELLPPPLPEPTADSELAPGVLVEAVEVEEVVASYSDRPVRVNELVAPSLRNWQAEIQAASGWDFLGRTLGAWRNIDQVRKKEMYEYDYGYLSWHKAGRALDLALEYKVDGVDQVVLVREDLGESVYWRMHLKTAEQDGSQGEPLREKPWRYWWHIVPESEPDAYEAGGRRIAVPTGYFVDITAIAEKHGWERIAAYAIEDDYHWLVDSNGTEYWHYENTGGLSWWDAMLQLYGPETLEQYAGWQAGLAHAQSEAMMRSKGVTEP